MSCDPHHGCITCGDVGIEMRVVAVDEAAGLATCADGDGAPRDVETALVGDVAPGDLLLVHADVGLARLEGESRHQDAGLDGPRR